MQKSTFQLSENIIVSKDTSARREGGSLVKRSANARKTWPDRARNNFKKLRSEVSLFASNDSVGGQVVTTSRQDIFKNVGKLF